MLRPFARLISQTGDTVTTYGDPFTMNETPSANAAVRLLLRCLL